MGELAPKGVLQELMGARIGKQASSTTSVILGWNEIFL